MKKSKDNMTGYAFIKFSDETLEVALTREKHVIDGRDCTLKFAEKRGGNMGGNIGGNIGGKIGGNVGGNR